MIASDPVVFLSAGADAIDAMLTTKESAVSRFADSNKVSLGSIAAIGDSVNDLPMLSMRGLAIRSAPSNAQDEVKSRLRGWPDAFLTRGFYFEGFEEFYHRCITSRVRLVFCDRDGVLLSNEESVPIARLHQIFAEMGNRDNPVIKIITGSSYEQNMRFIRMCRLDEAVRSNEYIRQDPYLILAENGALEIDVLTGAVRESPHCLDATLLRWLIRDFRSVLCESLETGIFPEFDLRWGRNPSDQIGRIFLPEKRTMVTVDLPRYAADGSQYRRTADAQRLRAAILEVMVGIMTRHGVPFALL